MRTRREDLRTGSLLTYFDPQERLQNRSLIFLVEGAEDVEPLLLTESSCRRLVEGMSPAGEFVWNAVADLGALTSIDPCLNPNRVVPIEAAELTRLDEEELERLFEPVLERLAAGSSELLPTIGGALGNPAEGLQLIGREELVAELDGHLREGRNLYLSAPRRSGKTSVLLRLEASAAAARAVYVDIERARDERHASALVRARCRREVPRAALAAIGNNWPAALRDSLAETAGTAGEPRALLLDELVFFLAGLENGNEEDWRERIRTFLEALGTAIESSGARLIVSGSADLFEFLAELGVRLEDLPTPIRRLERLRLPLLGADRVEIRRLLLGAGLVLELEELSWLDQNLDLSLPYPAQLFLDHLAAKARGGLPPQGAEALSQLRDDFLSQTSAFHDLQERLNRRAANRAGLRGAMNGLLDRLLEGPLPKAEIDASLPDVADRLWFFETYPVALEDNSIALVSKLFRRWWQLAGG